MLRLISKITIGNKSFKYVNDLTISSTWKTFTDTATIKIPNRFLKGKETIVAGSNNVFKRGDQVKIEIGYFDEMVTEFSGYVSKIKSGSPFEIDCEDAAFLLKQKTISKSWKSVSLKQLIGDIVDIPFETVSAELGAFKVTRVNAVQILAELKKTYGLTSFIRDGKLFVGVPYTGGGKDHEFDFNKNIISSNLEFVRSDDVKIKVNAISMNPDNTKTEVETGDADGDSRTLTFYNLTQSELKSAADREIDRLKYSGWRGSFMAFGKPSVQHGDTVTLNDDRFPERNGKYFIEGVEKSFGVNGFRQNIKLGAIA